jgi:hypothetical protein
MSAEAKFANGESILPQARPAQSIEWAWANGESGNIGADEYVAAGGSAITPTIGSAVLTGIASRNDRGIFVPTEVDV